MAPSNPSTNPPSPVGEESPPTNRWLDHRSVGVQLHPTSLPSPLGIGVLDASAHQLLHFLADGGFAYWQVCPLGPTGFGDSPYQCFSAFAGNPHLIALDPLVEAGLLPARALEPLSASSNHDRVDYAVQYQLKRPLLAAAHAHWRRSRSELPYGDFATFRHRVASWLDDYAYFTALKQHFSGRPWWEWPAELQSRELAVRSSLRRQLAVEIEAAAFSQYLFFGQWSALRALAAQLNIRLIGDAPIFVAGDSADVWANPQLFHLDPQTRLPARVAGVPPDYFSADGQLWGNPLYDWTAHAADGYRWWLDRLRTNFDLFDVVRIDHFRGFDACWAIPAGQPTARTGRWESGPGAAFFRAVRNSLPAARLIAEDLGQLTPSVHVLREAAALPGMAVLQFAFGGGPDNPYLPHNHLMDCVVYPGTHDNDTTLGWYASADEGTRDHVRRYLRVDGSEVGWDFVRAAYASVANLAVVSLPDLLSLGSEARFNTPGCGQGNWAWRYRGEMLQVLAENSGAYLRELGSLFGRSGSMVTGAENR